MEKRQPPTHERTFWYSAGVQSLFTSIGNWVEPPEGIYGRLVMIHEGGYSDAYVPFCGLAIMEELSGRKSDVVDPMLAFLKGWQPGEQHRLFTQDVLRSIQEELAR